MLEDVGTTRTKLVGGPLDGQDWNLRGGDRDQMYIQIPVRDPQGDKAPSFLCVYRKATLHIHAPGSGGMPAELVFYFYSEIDEVKGIRMLLDGYYGESIAYQSSTGNTHTAEAMKQFSETMKQAARSMGIPMKFSLPEVIPRTEVPRPEPTFPTNTGKYMSGSPGTATWNDWANQWNKVSEGEPVPDPGPVPVPKPASNQEQTKPKYPAWFAKAMQAATEKDREAADRDMKAKKKGHETRDSPGTGTG